MSRKLFTTAGAILALATAAAPPNLATGKADSVTHSSLPEPGALRFGIGQFKVIALSDGTLPLDVHPLLKGASNREIDTLLARNFERNPVETSINAFLVDTGTDVILIDAGAGELFGPLGGKLTASLASAGYSPEQVSHVLLTHIHTDHSGGIAKSGRIAFPNATVHAGSQDAEFFLYGGREGSRPEARHRDEAVATVGPYKAAGRLALFSGAKQILPGVTARPAPGHTPGHSIYRIENGGESLEFWGDLIHVGAVQLPRPEITITFDVDQDSARSQRLLQFNRAAKDGTLVAAAHLNFPGIGRLRSNGKGYDWVPAPHRLR